jgi:hypothetical protein
LNPMEIATEEENEEALRVIEDLWGIVKYLDIETQRDYNNLFMAIESFEEWFYEF